MADNGVNFEEGSLISLLGANDPNSSVHAVAELNLNLENEVGGNLDTALMAADRLLDDAPVTNQSDQNPVILPSDADQEQLIPKPMVETNNDLAAMEIESPTTGENFTFKCVFCDQILTSNDDPKLLECLHNSCSSCVSSRLYDQSMATSDQGMIECTFCGMFSRQHKVIDNQFLMESSNTAEESAAASKAAELKCSSCSEDIMATSWCVECAEFICDICVQAHQRLKITKDHTIKLKEEGLMENQSTSNGFPANLYCNVHPHEKLSLFCENCDQLTCRDCQLIEHREHKYKFTNEIATEARKYIMDMLKDVGYKRALLNSAMKVIDDRQNLITDKKQALVKEITQVVVRLTTAINVRGKQLAAKLTEVCDSKQKTLQEKKQALEQLSKMTDYCINFTQHALDHGSDMALLYSKKQMTEHLKRIKCRRADIPNPEIPVRIHLALDKIPELVKVISTIGQIVVDGRIYPNPEPQQQQQQQPNMIHPIGSPSPGQRSPITQLVQQHHHMQQQPQQQQQHLQQQQQPPFQSVRPPPPYRPQGFQTNQQQFTVHHQPQSISPHRVQNMGPPNMVAMSNQGILAQQLNSVGAPIRNMQRQQPSPHQQQPQLTQQQLPPQQQQQQRPILTQHQQQVSSSTHPHGMMHDRNSALRGLLQPNQNAVYVQTGPLQYQAVQPGPQMAQFHARFPNSGATVYRQQQQQPQHQQPQTASRFMNTLANNQNRAFQQSQQRMTLGAKWHIPQQALQTSGSAPSPTGSGRSASTNLPAINDNFKITLKSQTPTATVTSTIPKTPSPNHVQNGGKSDTERNLDKCCEDSVKDLMATIAKLDSNGVQVLAESGRQKSSSGGSPHVDSSTGDTNGRPHRPMDPSGSVSAGDEAVKPESGDASKDDPNEDWCAVCMDGGELICCDKCPKVFHQYCHIPSLSVDETGDTWQCLLCINFADMAPDATETREEGKLTARERKIAERLVLELYCQYDLSLPFREVISSDNIDYHAIIKTPMALDTIRQKLKWDSEHHYKTLEGLLRDVRLMFKNAYNYNSVDSLVYQDAKMLEKFFDEQLEKFLPEYAYETFEDDSGIPPNKKAKRMISD